MRLTVRELMALTVLLWSAAVARAGGLPVDVGVSMPEKTGIYYTDANGGQRGVPVHSGDFNGDGFLDLAGAPFSASTLSRSSNGNVQIVFGDGTLGHEINMATYSGPALKIHGAENFSLLGVEMGVGDFDEDGYDDLVMGSSHGKFFGEAPRAGEVVILYGRPEWGTTVTSLDIKNLPVGQRAKFIIGEREGDRLGSWFSVADIDENNAIDLVMGMDLSDGPSANKTNVGAAVILWDADTAYPAAARLRVGDVATSDSFTIIYGHDAQDLFGATNWVADFDDDQNPDLVISAGVTRSGLAIGALSYSGTGGGDGPVGGRNNAGETTIFWNAAALRGYRSIDSASALPSGIESTIIYGRSGGDYFGEELYGADVTGDGVQDLLVGALVAAVATPGIRPGALYLFPGGSTLRGLSSIDLASPPSNFVVAFEGDEANSIAGDTVEAFDVNRDGIDDLFYSVPQGDLIPGSNRGEGYTQLIIGGQAFPTMPDRVTVSVSGTSPSLNCVLIEGADAGDLFAYSSGCGDFNNDGILDYLPNAMQGDGFGNGFPGAGEDYIIDGLTIGRHAAAPIGLIGNGAAPQNQPVAQWEITQPIIGPVIGYELDFLPTGEVTPIIVTVTGTQALRSDFASFGTIRAVRSVMDGGTFTERSVWNYFNPAIEIVEPPTPTPTLTPVPSPTVSLTPTPSLTPVPSPSPTLSPTVSPTPTPSPVPTPTISPDGAWILN